MIVNIKIRIAPKNICDATTEEAATQVGAMLGTVFADYTSDESLIAGTYVDNIEYPKGVRHAEVIINWHNGMDD